MTRARGDIGLDGFLNLCKEAGPTSHDAVARVRRILGTRRIGHAGTLDPLAEGVLPLAIGRATRLVDRLADAGKSYYAEVELGVVTTTDDAEGAILKQRSVPAIETDDLDAALAAFEGEILQRPPVFSAVKVSGQRAYALARAGQRVELKQRRVTIRRLERLGWTSPVLSIRVYCSKGTYIRSLARDLGERLGTGASLRRLVRLSVGPFALEQAVDIAELAERGPNAILAPDALLLDLPSVVLDSDELLHLLNGRTWRTAGPVAPLARVYTAGGRFAGVVAGDNGMWQPKTRFLD